LLAETQRIFSCDVGLTNLYEASLFFGTADDVVREAAGPGWADAT
jgi:hypothetical protein